MGFTVRVHVDGHQDTFLLQEMELSVSESTKHMLGGANPTVERFC